MHQKNILLVCYEYEGYNSNQTTALVKRPRYVAENLAQRGYHVTVLFSYSREFKEKKNYNKGSLELISVKYQFSSSVQNKILQKFRTAWLAYTKGDFSSEWTLPALKKIEQEKLVFSSVICFYTPRGPLELGYQIAKRTPIKLIYDFQDPIYEGFSNPLSRILLDEYYTKIFKSTSAVSCVSKQWSAELSRFFTDTAYIPHAIEYPIKLVDDTVSNKLVIFYYGSIDFNFQKVDSLLDFHNLVTSKIPNLSIELKFAGNEQTYIELKNRFSNSLEVNYLGWLNKNQLYQEVASSDVLCLLSWEVRERIGIPSKFYEYCRFDKPILILGEDAGGFEIEFGKEFAIKFIPFKVQNTISNKEELLSSLFRPDSDFLERYSLSKL
jgi:hypothetical protein